MSKKCPKGDILRKGYNRKAYSREGYIKNSTGEYIEPVSVKATYVPPTCIKERGKGTHRLLPKLKNDISLRKFGYKTDLPANERHVALKNAAKASDLLLVERRLNLIRNKQVNEIPKEIMTKDVDYLHNLYVKERAKYGRNRRSYALREKEDNTHLGSYKIKVKGGQAKTDITYEKFLLNVKIKHNNLTVEFRTLTHNDMDKIEKLDKVCENHANVVERLDKSELIGLLINDRLKGYVSYTIADHLKIDHECVSEKYKKILDGFVAKYFKS